MTHHLTKPIRAIHFMVLAFLMTIGTHVSAAETVMMCDGHQGDKYYYKLVNPLWGDRKMLSKNKGQWDDWCKTVAGEFKPCEIEIYESGAKMTQYTEDKFTTGQLKGATYRRHVTVALDFEFEKRFRETKIYYGDNFTSEITEADDPDLIAEYSCEIIE